MQKTENKLKDMDEALDNNDMDKIKDMAHSIKGSALSLRLYAIASPARMIEKNVHPDKLEQLAHEIHNLQKMYAAVCKSIETS